MNVYESIGTAYVIFLTALSTIGLFWLAYKGLKTVVRPGVIWVQEQARDEEAVNIPVGCHTPSPFRG